MCYDNEYDNDDDHESYMYPSKYEGKTNKNKMVHWFSKLFQVLKNWSTSLTDVT